MERDLLIDIKEIEDILKIHEDIGSINDLDSLLEKELLETRRLTHADAGTIYIMDESNLRLGYVQNDALFSTLEGSKFIYSNKTIKIDESSIAGYVALTGEILAIEDVYNLGSVPYSFDKEFDEKSSYRTKSMLSVPIKDCNNNTLGVLQLINAMDNGSIVYFSRKDQAFTRLFASFAAAAIKKAQDNRAEVLDMVEVVISYDPHETGAHANRVASYAVEIYQQWALDQGLPEDKIRKYKDILRLAAMLHDIGKISLGEGILKKKEKLTKEEFEEIKKHTTRSTNYFSDKEAPWTKMAFEIALNHHEKWDGKGYPHGKKGTEIPLAGRIVAVADVYDAIKFSRLYKGERPHDEVCKTILGGNGKHFDPSIATAFLKIEGIIENITQRYAA